MERSRECIGTLSSEVRRLRAPDVKRAIIALLPGLIAVGVFLSSLWLVVSDADVLDGIDLAIGLVGVAEIALACFFFRTAFRPVDWALTEGAVVRREGESDWATVADYASIQRIQVGTSDRLTLESEGANVIIETSSGELKTIGPITHAEAWASALQQSVSAHTGESVMVSQWE